MPDYRRFFAPGGTFFFTLNLRNRRSALLVERIDDLRASWREVAARWPFETVAAVILPEHMHVVLKLPEDDHDYAKRLRRIKHGFTQRLPDALKSAGRKGERNVWQSRYWEHMIRSDDDLETHVNYIHFNPVKHGYVPDMDDWPYSTWRRFKQEFGRAWSPSHPATVGER